MKVRELIELLEDSDPELEVHFAYDYGDHIHTIVAPKVVRVVDDGYVEYSEYHRMPKVWEYDDDEDHEDAEETNDKATPAVILFSTRGC